MQDYKNIECGDRIIYNGYGVPLKFKKISKAETPYALIPATRCNLQ